MVAGEIAIYATNHSWAAANPTAFIDLPFVSRLPYGGSTIGETISQF